MTHTPTPWVVEMGHSVAKIIGGVGERVADTTGTPYYESCSELDRANAALIVRAVNSHEALVQALENLLGLFALFISRDDLPPDVHAALTQHWRINEARAALRLAKGE